MRRRGQSAEAQLPGDALGALAQLAAAVEHLTGEVRSHVANDIAVASLGPHQAQQQRQDEQAQRQDGMGQDETVHQVCYALLGAVQLQAACHDVLCAGLEEKLGIPLECDKGTAEQPVRMHGTGLLRYGSCEMCAVFRGVLPYVGYEIHLHFQRKEHTSPLYNA